MNKLVNEVMEQVTHLPAGIDRPGVLIGSVAAGAAIGAAGWLVHGRAEETYASQTPNRELLKETIRTVAGNQAAWDKLSRRHRMGSSLLELIGIGVTAGSLLSGMHYDTTVPHTDAHTVVLLDSSSSMRYTADLGADSTRYDAVLEGLEGADYEGGLAIVEVANGVTTRLPMTTDWRNHIEALHTPQVDPNGGLLTDGMNEAIEELPVSADGLTRAGSLFVFSDGQIESTSEQIIAMQDKLEANDINTTVIVPGTLDGAYVLEATDPIPAGIQPDKLRRFTDDEPVIVDSAAEVASAIQEAATTAGTTRREKPWHIPAVAGLTMLVSGIVINFQQRTNKK